VEIKVALLAEIVDKTLASTCTFAESPFGSEFANHFDAGSPAQISESKDFPEID
jgi:hypothetical protein